jgi:hypothetical protein
VSSRKIPIETIPSVEEEKPIRNLHGYVFSNPAYHARHDDLFPPKAGEPPVPQEFRDAIDIYLGNFCRPVRSIANEVRCVACNEDLTTPYGREALITQLGGARLKVDRQSPDLDARCGNCGYPVRCRHVISPLPPRPPVPVLVRLDFFPMCYHPRATDRRGLIH